MRRLVVVLLLSAILVSILPHSANTEPPISLVVNGSRVITDVPPQLVNGRVLVPLRAVVESLGKYAYWLADTRTVVIDDYPLDENGQRLGPLTVKVEPFYSDVCYWIKLLREKHPAGHQLLVDNVRFITLSDELSPSVAAVAKVTSRTISINRQEYERMRALLLQHNGMDVFHAIWCATLVHETCHIVVGSTGLKDVLHKQGNELVSEVADYHTLTMLGLNRYIWEDEARREIEELLPWNN